MPLQRHDWDTDDNRAAIHLAFDIWFACYMSVPQNTHQVARWRAELRRLTDRAEQRRAIHEEQERIALEFRAACSSGGLAEV